MIEKPDVAKDVNLARGLKYGYQDDFLDGLEYW